MRMLTSFVVVATIISSILILPARMGVATSPAASGPPSSELALKEMNALSLSFTKNEGQWDDRVLFRTSSGGATVWFCRDGIYYQFVHRMPREVADRDDPMGMLHRRLPGLPGAKAHLSSETRASLKEDSIETVVVKAMFVDANSSVEVTGEGFMDYKCNYFLGNDPLKWRTNVPNYSGVVYRDLYPGIDAHFEGQKGLLNTRYEAKPGAELSRVQFRYDGNAAVTLTDAGELRIEAPWGLLPAAT